MRFLLFNAVVLAALTYLFTMEKADYQDSAERLRYGVEQVRTLAKKALSREEKAEPEVDYYADLLEKAPMAPDRAEVPVTAADEPEASPPQPAPVVEDPVENQPAEKQLVDNEPEPPVQAEVDAPLHDSNPESEAPTQADESRDGVVSPVESDLALNLPPVSDPAVAKRRAEVLEGIAEVAPAPPSNQVALAEGETLMTPQERMRDLQALAEEMELLFVDKLAQ